MNAQSIKITVLLLAFATISLFAQTSPDLDRLDKQIKSKQGELGKLRKEISLYESRIARKEQAEANELSRLYDLEERISLTSRYITALANELQQLDQGIKLARLLVRRQENEIAELQQKLADRFVHIYKQRRSSMDRPSAGMTNSPSYCPLWEKRT